MFSLEHVANIRAAEIEAVVPYFPKGCAVLELGAGTGQQAKMLSERGFNVTAVEVSDSRYSASCQFPIANYDGRTLPFPDGVFDLVFSSNVLEHVADLDSMNAEIKRVLKPHGLCLHVMPTHVWRFWTTATAIFPIVQQTWKLRSFSPQSLIGAVRSQLVRHGERGNAFTEACFFHPRWWRKLFQKSGFEVVSDRRAGLFYTGNMTFGTKLSLKTRSVMAVIFGSACHIYFLRAI